MRNLIALFVRYGSFLTFIFLEIVCFYFIVNFNSSQRDIWLNSSSLFSGKILDQRNQISEYLALEDINDKLQEENAKLKSELIKLKGYGNELDIDTSYQFELIPASIINQEYRNRNNYITLNKGASDNVSKDMGVITPDGIVGIIKNTSANYARAISLLNTQARISALVKNTDFFGDLVWDGNDPSIMTLEAIPRYAGVQIGDTIVTSGYSSIFPKDLMIGTIDNFEPKEGTSYLSINVMLNTKMARLNKVYIISNTQREEILELENE